ncbi:MAG: hypothetical protein IPK99_14705 [Flavobacteriales bacterium]|nr:hypothetical protein [Flavobacteriales bacterium]
MGEPRNAIPFHHDLVAEIRGQALALDGATLLWEHAGSFRRADLDLALHRVENFSVDRSDATAVRKRLISVLVEGMENILVHVGEGQAALCAVMVLRTSSDYRLVFINPVPLATAALLQHRIDFLNEMDEVGLKEHYLKLLANRERTERGGAGLGLLTMARRSQRPMRVSCKPLSETEALFALELAVPLGD